MPKAISLPASDTAITIDEADYERVSAYGWCVNGPGYVVANINNCVIQLSRFLLTVSNGHVVIHRNHNRLDFRRKNLRIVTHSEAMQRQKKNGLMQPANTIRGTAAQAVRPLAG